MRELKLQLTTRWRFCCYSLHMVGFFYEACVGLIHSSIYVIDYFCNKNNNNNKNVWEWCYSVMIQAARRKKIIFHLIFKAKSEYYNIIIIIINTLRSRCSIGLSFMPIFASRHVSPFSPIAPPSMSGSLSLLRSPCEFPSRAVLAKFPSGLLSGYRTFYLQCSTGWCHTSCCSCSRRHILAAWLTDPSSFSPVHFPRPRSDYKGQGEPPLKAHQQSWLPLEVYCRACCLPTVELFYSILDLSGGNGTRPDVQLVFTGFFFKMR